MLGAAFFISIIHIQQWIIIKLHVNGKEAKHGDISL